MTGIKLEDSATRSLITALDGLAARQRAIGNNLANVDTPGYKASDVSFGRQLAAAMSGERALPLARTQAKHLPGAAEATDAVQVVSRGDTSKRLDGNNVDIEKEMASLTETGLHFQAAAQLISRRLASLRTVINEGRR